ncbi:hypothetical protein 1 [Wenzhou picorna-like virus 17]|uniref:hypothetical protein 1 n=1 Tax=Wenzhou picorna-like virus 17 TaxID=1923601 RepID=UPI00090A5AF8|nr:hypothetical protein 1 [Wenzhou picorna-like virus 17]APG78553.1 hypothetical protein 1 [Wenzhou picorna-like virus 17]
MEHFLFFEIFENLGNTGFSAIRYCSAAFADILFIIGETQPYYYIILTLLLYNVLYGNYINLLADNFEKHYLLIFKASVIKLIYLFADPYSSGLGLSIILFSSLINFIQEEYRDLIFFSLLYFRTCCEWIMIYLFGVYVLDILKNPTGYIIGDILLQILINFHQRVLESMHFYGIELLPKQNISILENFCKGLGLKISGSFYVSFFMDKIESAILAMYSLTQVKDFKGFISVLMMFCKQVGAHSHLTKISEYWQYFWRYFSISPASNGDNFFDTLRSWLDGTGGISDFTYHISIVVSWLMSCAFVSDRIPKFSVDMVETFLDYVRNNSFYKKSTNPVLTLMDSATFLLSGGWKALFHSDYSYLFRVDNYHKWYNDLRRIADGVNELSTIKSGKHEYFKDLQHFSTELTNIKHRGERFVCQLDVGHKNISRDALKTMNNQMNLIGNIRRQFSIFTSSSELRKVPFVVSLIGEPGVGKSTILSWLRTQYALMHGLENSPEHIYTVPPSIERWDGYRDQWCLTIDDLGALRPQLRPDENNFRIIDIVGNTPALTAQAAIEDKGVTFLKAQFVTVTSNNRDFDLTQYFNNPGAASRRLPLRYEVKLRPGKSELGVVSQYTVQEINEVYAFDIFVLTEVTNNKALFTQTASDVTMDFLLRDLAERITKHDARQNQVILNDNLISKMELCACGILIGACSQCAKPVAKRNKSLWSATINTLRDFIWLQTIVGMALFAFDPERLMYTIRVRGYMLYSVVWDVKRSVKSFLVQRSYIPHHTRNTLPSVHGLFKSAYLYYFCDIYPPEEFGKNFSKWERFCKWTYFVSDPMYFMTWDLNNDYDFENVSNMYERIELGGKYKDVFRYINWITLFISMISLTQVYKHYVGSESKQERIKPVTIIDQAQAWKESITTYFTSDQSSVDFQTVSKRVRDNYYTFVCQNDVESYKNVAIYIFDNWFVTVYHGYRPNYQLYLIKEYNGVKSVVRVDHSTVRIEKERDLVFFQCHNVAPRKSLLPFFSTIDDIIGNLTCALIGAHAGENGPNNKGEVMCIAEVYDSLVYGDYTLSKSYMIHVNTIGGMCGSLLIHRGTGNRSRIIGLLVAASINGPSWVTPISASIILKNCRSSFLFPPQPMSSLSYVHFLNEPNCSELPLSDISIFRYIGEMGSLEPLCSTTINKNPTMKSRVYKNPLFYDSVFAVEPDVGLYGIPIFNSKKGTRVSPLKKNLSHIKAMKVDIGVPALEHASLDYLKRFDLTQIPKFKPLEANVSINSWNNIPGLKFSTSLGFPWKCKKNARLPNREETHFVQNIDGTWKMDIYHYEKVYELISLLEKRVLVSPPFCGSLKDEKRLLSKIEEGLIRLFAGANIHLTIVMRMYFMPLISFLTSDFSRSEMAIGVNSFSCKWKHFYKYLTNFGEDRLVFGDFSKFDKNMGPRLILSAFWILRRLAKLMGYSEQDLTVLEMISWIIAYPIIECKGDLAQCIGSNPSGHVLTTIINCIVNSLLHRLAYYTHFTREFNLVVNLLTYGDDCAYGVHKSVDFSHTIAQIAFVGLGYKYTMADKQSQSRPFIHISQGTFLKRYFRKYSSKTGDYILDPLEPLSLYLMLAWSFQGGLLEDDRAAQILYQAELEILRQPNYEQKRLRPLLDECWSILFEQNPYRSRVYFDADSTFEKLLAEDEVVMDFPSDQAGLWSSESYKYITDLLLGPKKTIEDS